MIVVAIVTGAGGIITGVWTVVVNRRKPDLDRQQIKDMVDKSNLWRDTRLWQLESYLNSVIGWQHDVALRFRRLLAALRKLQDDKILPKSFAIPDEFPEPPPIPEPPPRL